MPQRPPITTVEVGEPESTAAVPVVLELPMTAGKTPEQIEKERKIAELKEEGMVCCGVEEPPIPNAFYVALYYSPHVAIVLLAFIALLYLREKKRGTERKSWRAWLRGRI